MKQFILLLPALPLLSAVLSYALSGLFGRAVVRISLSFSVLTVLLAGLLLWLSMAGETASLHTLNASTWGSLLFDPLSVLMGLVIAGISLLVRVYSVRYMVEEAGYIRFFVLLDLMTAALLLMVAAGDLITLLIAWHLIGVLLYFLLGHDTRSESAFRYGFWTFITYRIGDLPLILAAALLFHAYDTWSLPDIFRLMHANPEMTTVAGLPLAEVVAALIALAAFARSAQFLLHTWLPYTMEGPTPVSALMHAGIVNAGGFLINRFAPIYMHTDSVLHWVFIVGLLTAVIGSLLMLCQNDIKKSLGYSTMGQMGFMVMEMGVGAFALAVFHLIAHGLFKGTMFLNAGSVIGDARQHDGVPKDDLYTFIVEKRRRVSQQPWLLMALLTLIVPIVVLFLSHWLVEPELFHQQGAIVLLFFGWITGAQLLFVTYHLGSQNHWRLMSMMIVSFIIVVIGYTVISHAFTVFLYPDHEQVTQLYAAAAINDTTFMVLMLLVSLVIVGGWLSVYYADRGVTHTASWLSRLWLHTYALLSRELYVAEGFAVLNRQLLAWSARVNLWLKWG